MKMIFKLFVAAAVLLCGATLNAQTLSTENPDQLLLNKEYKHLKSVRTSGIVLMSVGTPSVVAGTGLMIGGIVAGQSNPNNVAGATIAVGSGLFLTAAGIVMTAVGAPLYGIANNKMKKIVPASNGVGLAYVF